MGAFSGCEASVLIEHEAGLMAAFCDEYYASGGPKLDAAEVLLMFKLAYAGTLVPSLAFIESEVYVEGPSKAEWPSITDRWDERIMGVWNVRCRVIAIVEMLSYFVDADLHSTVMGWVRTQPGLEDGPL